MTAPYYEDDTVTLWLGDCRDVLPAIGIQPDCVIADPPYQETSLGWDRWQDGWPDAIAKVASSMWCFGSMRMFLDRCCEFAGWSMSQDLVWCKQNGTSLAADRFRRVHEHVVHWYRGRWGDIHHETPREAHYGRREGARVMSGQDRGAHLGSAGKRLWSDDGTRLTRSVIEARNAWRQSLHPTEKPVAVLDLLIRYGCPPGGLVLDPFAGSGSTAAAARLSGRMSVLIEADERYCEVIARRLSQDVLPLAVTS